MEIKKRGIGADTLKVEKGAYAPIRLKYRGTVLFKRCFNGLEIDYRTNQLRQTMFPFCHQSIILRFCPLQLGDRPVSGYLELL